MRTFALTWPAATACAAACCWSALNMVTEEGRVMVMVGHQAGPLHWPPLPRPLGRRGKGNCFCRLCRPDLYQQEHVLPHPCL